MLSRRGLCDELINRSEEYKKRTSSLKSRLGSLLTHFTCNICFNVIFTISARFLMWRLSLNYQENYIVHFQYTFYRTIELIFKFSFCSLLNRAELNVLDMYHAV